MSMVKQVKYEHTRAFAASALLALKGGKEHSTTKTNTCLGSVHSPPLQQNHAQCPGRTAALKQIDTLPQKRTQTTKRIEQSKKPTPLQQIDTLPQKRTQTTKRIEKIAKTTPDKTRKKPKVVRKSFCKVLKEEIKMRNRIELLYMMSMI
jgi:hypothetical protein